MSLVDKVRAFPNYPEIREISYQLIYMGMDLAQVDSEYDSEAAELMLEYKGEKERNAKWEYGKDRYTLDEVKAKIQIDLKEKKLEYKSMEEQYTRISAFIKTCENELFSQDQADRIAQKAYNATK